MVAEEKKTHLFRHVVVNDHHNASYDDFEITGTGFRNNALIKVAETLLIKELRPTLNFQKKSVNSKLFN